MGNLLNSERGTISIAGNLSSATDIDFYQFEVTFDSIQNIQGFTNPLQHLAAILDIDYADGLARANTRITVFDANGNVVLHAADSNIADDQPAPLNGTDTDDLSRGSVGTLGSVHRHAGTAQRHLLRGYLVRRADPDRVQPVLFADPGQHVSSAWSRSPRSSGLRKITLTRWHSRPSSRRRFRCCGTTSPSYLTIWATWCSSWRRISTGSNNGRLYTVDPFTGVVETTVGNLNRNIEDIAMRQDGGLYSFSVDESNPVNDGGSGNYLLIDTGNAAITNVGDDGIETWQANTATPPGDVRHDVGYQFNALAFGTPVLHDQGGATYLFAVGDRTVPGLLNQYTENVLYRFNADSGQAVSLFQDRTGPGNAGGPRYAGAGTQIVERGFLDTSPNPLTADTQLLLVEATEVDPATDATTFLITDGTLFSVDHDANPLTAALFFEFNAGPEIRVHPNAAAGNFVQDGDFFEIDGDTFEFDTGSVIVSECHSGSQIADGATFTLDRQQLDAGDADLRVQQGRWRRAGQYSDGDQQRHVAAHSWCCRLLTPSMVRWLRHRSRGGVGRQPHDAAW